MPQSSWASRLLCLSMLLPPMTAAAQQTPTPQTPDWQTKAGGSQQFEVASVRPRPSGAPFDHSINLDLSGDDYFRYPGGLVKSNGTLAGYIVFAYKIDDVTEYWRIQAQLPKWAQTTVYTVEARPPGKPTKDQLRLMMQSLLIERFGLAMHTEARELPAYVLVLDKPGQPGPQLRPHPDDGLCYNPPKPNAEKAKPALPGAAPGAYCAPISWSENGLTHLRIMDWTMDQIAGELSHLGAGVGDMELLPVVNRTGLPGRYDIEVKFLWRRKRTSSDPNAEPETLGPSFVDALRSQAGLKLIKQTAPIRTLIIDHIEPPSEN